MKKLLAISLLLLGIVRCPAPYLSNPFTTNDTPTSLNVVSNIANAAVAGGIGGSLNPTVIGAAGGLTTNNATTYGYLRATNSPFMGSFLRSDGGTNGFYSVNGGPLTNLNATSLTGLVPTSNIPTSIALKLDATNAAGIMYSNNPKGYLVDSAAITKLTNSPVTTIVSGGGITVSSSTDSAGTHYTVSATGTNQVSVTNLSPTVLANAGGLTTNNFATYADLAGAAQAATNGYPWGSLYDPAGAALAATNTAAIVRTNNPVFVLALTNAGAFDAAGAALSATNAGNIRFTNTPVIGSIIISSNIVATYTTNSSGIITATLGAQPSGATGNFQPASLNLTNWSGISTSQLVLTTNIVTQIIGGTNINLSATTNAGQVSVSINQSYFSQPASGNLTNWSQVPTNAYVPTNTVLLTTNVVTRIVAGTNVTVTASTNASGITYTITASGGGSTEIRAGVFTATAGSTGTKTFTSAMSSTPVVTIGAKGWTVGGASSFYDNAVIIQSTSTTGFTWSNFRGVNNVDCYYIATIPQ